MINDAFSVLCTKLGEIDALYSEEDPISTHYGYDDSEWRADQAEKQAHKLIAEAGYTPRSFKEELEKRTSIRWAYFSGLIHLVGDMSSVEENKLADLGPHGRIE